MYTKKVLYNFHKCNLHQINIHTKRTKTPALTLHNFKPT